MPGNLAESYERCGQIVRRASTNFYWSFMLLPPLKRRAMAALYAFARHTDDLGDSDAPLVEREAALAAWRQSFADALLGDRRDPILPAVADAVQSYRIPARYLMEIIDGVEMDLRHDGFATFADLRHYCYHVASAVGLACLHIWGFQNEEAVREPAIECGIAFQLTNILRDVKEDAQRGRIYLPREDVTAFGYSDAELRGNVNDDRFLALMRQQIERTERCYHNARATVPHLHRDGRRMFGMMFNTYHGLLAKIHDDPAAVLTSRVSLTFPHKLRIATVSCLWGIT